MSFLKTLTFTSINDLTPSLLEQKRCKLISKFKEQLSLLNDPDLTVARKRWMTVDGEKVLEEKTLPVRPWWRETLDGRVAFSVRVGLKKVEFQRGMTAILVPSLKELPTLIEGLIKAVNDGELDHLLVPKEGPKIPQRKSPA